MSSFRFGFLLYWAAKLNGHDKRLRVIGYSEYTQELRVITSTIQDLLGILKPKDIDIDLNSAFIEIDPKSNIWNYEDNLGATLVFPNDFGLLKSEFEKFKSFKKTEGTIRIDRYYWDGSRKIMVDDSQINTLDFEEQKLIIVESMEWHDAVIIQKKNLDGMVLSEALVQIKQDAEEIIIKTNGGSLHDKTSIFMDSINWFRNLQYPSKMREPFTLTIPFSSLPIFESLSNKNDE